MKSLNEFLIKESYKSSDTMIDLIKKIYFILSKVDNSKEVKESSAKYIDTLLKKVYDNNTQNGIIEYFDLQDVKGGNLDYDYILNWFNKIPFNK